MVSRQPGQDSGRGGRPAPGFGWGDLIGSLVEAHGTLAAVAWRLIEVAPGDDVASVERALRRLRTRGQRDGGVWGQRLLRVFGVPATVEARVRWMGLYQSPFNDLPRAVCLDQLRLWDRPPVTGSRARLWLHLGLASCALRGRELDEAAAQLGRAEAALAGRDEPAVDAARIELALARAYLCSERGDAEAAGAELGRAEAGLAAARALDDAERACFLARVVDQRAYQDEQRGDPAAALARYRALSDDDVHPFASFRRDAGRARGLLRAGDRDAARPLALRACEHAGDGGYTRLRAMGLLLLAEIDGRPAGDAARARAAAIAERLDDAELRRRSSLSPG